MHMLFHCDSSPHCDGKYIKYTIDIEPGELLTWDDAHGCQGRIYHFHQLFWCNLFLLLPWRLHLRFLYQTLLHYPHLRTH